MFQSFPTIPPKWFVKDGAKQAIEEIRELDELCLMADANDDQEVSPWELGELKMVKKIRAAESARAAADSAKKAAADSAKKAAADGAEAEEKHDSVSPGLRKVLQVLKPVQAASTGFQAAFEKYIVRIRK